MSRRNRNRPRAAIPLTGTKEPLNLQKFEEEVAQEIGVDFQDDAALRRAEELDLYDPE